MITYTDKNIYWNYYISIEDDLYKLSRYIEFDMRNEAVFSIELVRLLISSSSEFEVVAKEFCKVKDPSKTIENIIDIRDNLLAFYPVICDLEIIIPRFGLHYQPFIKWKTNENLEWWTSYNSVKHHRNSNYEEGNLRNVMNAIGALYIINLYYFNSLQERRENMSIDMEETLFELSPRSSLIKVNHPGFYTVPYTRAY